ncbi:hypothetical protein Tco_0805362 [Tanacetum coccineum]
MRQRRWIELLSDYECEIKYHPCKANVVADALSRKERLKPRRVELSKDLKAPAEWLRGLERHFEQRADGEIYFFDHKMYYDLRDLYWWPGMKRDIADIAMDFITQVPKSSSGYDTIGSLWIDCPSRTSFPTYSYEDLQNEKPGKDYDHSKNCSETGKTSTKNVGPFEILEHVDRMAYRLEVTPEAKIEIDENLCFVEEPIEIVERDVKKLKRRRIPLVKVRWNSRQGAEYTWEHEDQFRMKYPHLFSEPVPSSNVAT